MKDSVRLNFEFPKQDYPFLKMMCAQKGMSLKELATNALLKEIEEYEDKFFAQKAEARLKDNDDKNNISFDEACKLAGWEDE